MKRNQFNNLPVAEIIECNVMGQQTIMEIDGRLKFLRIGDKLYTQPSQAAQPEQTVEPVAWQWLDTGTFRKTLPKTAVVADWHPLFKNSAPIAQQEQQATLSPISETLWEAILGAIARGWCHQKNASKTMDPDLAVAIGKEIKDLIAQPQQPAAQKSRTESEIVALAYTLSDSRYCSNRIGKVAFNYDQLQAFVTAIAQPDQPAPVRQLLTHTEIVKIYDESMSDWVFERDNPYVKFARAIEVAHGIAQPKDKP